MPAPSSMRVLGPLARFPRKPRRRRESRAVSRNRPMAGSCRDTCAWLALVALARHAQQSKSEEHTSELQSLMRISYAVFCLKKKKQQLTAWEKQQDKKRR